MVGEAGKQRVAWQILYNAIFGDGHKTAHRMTHSLHGGNDRGHHNGFAALSKAIEISLLTDQDSDYVQEHSVLKYLRIKVAHFLHDYHQH